MIKLLPSVNHDDSVHILLILHHLDRLKTDVYKRNARIHIAYHN